MLTADKVNSVVQGQQAGYSPLLKGVLHQMLPSVFSVQSLPVLFSGRRNCWLALTSLIAFDRGAVAVFPCQDGFLHVLYKPKSGCSPAGDAVNSSGVSVSQKGRLQAEHSQRRRKVCEWGTKEKTRLWVRGENGEEQEDSLLELLARIHLWKVHVHLPCISVQSWEDLNTVFHRTLFFLHWKQFPLMG